MIPFEGIWERISSHQGDVFRQIRGKTFTYTVSHSSVTPSTVNQNIPRGDFEKAVSFLPLENTVLVQHLRGPSYIYAILMDERIRLRDW